MKNQNSKLHFRRFEFKYLLSKPEAEAIKKDISHFLIPDAHIEKNQGYWANSIYFDNQEFTCFWEKIDGLVFRRKLRFRVYGDKKDSAIFLELKRKQGDIILKDRLVVEKKNLPDFFNGSWSILNKARKEEEFDLIKEYLAFKTRLFLRPVVFIRYFRQPFISRHQDLRLTFDQDIRVNPLQEFSFDPDPDKEEIILDKTVVLELKFTGSLPYWLYHLIKKYNLKREAFSKYCRGIENIYIKAL